MEDEEGVHLALKLSRAPLATTGKNPIQCERFFQGAIAPFALRDSINVVRLADVGFLGTHQGAYPYLLMELVPRAECITTWAARTTPTLVNLVEIFIDLADTLGTMADRKICHRDLKPQNILIESPRDIPRLIDLNSVSLPIQKTLTAPAASAIPYQAQAGQRRYRAQGLRHRLGAKPSSGVPQLAERRSQQSP